MIDRYASALPQFDLTEIMIQVRNDLECSDWGFDQFREAEIEYRQFLALCKTYPGTGIMPTRLADAVWHKHILNTNQYATDTYAYFGYFLHHQPCRPPLNVVERSILLFDFHFGVKSDNRIVMCYCTDGTINSKNEII